jgi:hypothetical protein
MSTETLGFRRKPLLSCSRRAEDQCATLRQSRRGKGRFCNGGLSISRSRWVSGLSTTLECIQREEMMAKQVEVKGRQFWILSEPSGSGWKATVVEVTAGQGDENVGIDATGETRGVADDSAERKLRRLLKGL